MIAIIYWWATNCVLDIGGPIASALAVISKFGTTDGIRVGTR